MLRRIRVAAGKQEMGHGDQISGEEVPVRPRAKHERKLSGTEDWGGKAGAEQAGGRQTKGSKLQGRRVRHG